MSWASEGEVTIALAAALKRDPATLPAYVTSIVASSVENAREQIRNVLNPAGYTESLILRWRSLRAFHRHQALYWSEVELREMFQDRESDLHKLKNRIAELNGLILYDDTGVIIPPVDAVAHGGVSSGVLTVRSDFDAREVRRRQRQYGYGYDCPWG